MASVTVGDELVGSIGRGLLLLVGFGRGDTVEQLQPMAGKVANLRCSPIGPGASAIPFSYWQGLRRSSCG